MYMYGSVVPKKILKDFFPYKTHIKMTFLTVAPPDPIPSHPLKVGRGYELFKTNLIQNHVI
jgi:hypothetical protein